MSILLHHFAVSWMLVIFRWVRSYVVCLVGVRLSGSLLVSLGWVRSSVVCPVDVLLHRLRNNGLFATQGEDAILLWFFSLSFLDIVASFAIYLGLYGAHLIYYCTKEKKIQGVIAQILFRNLTFLPPI